MNEDYQFNLFTYCVNVVYCSEFYFRPSEYKVFFTKRDAKEYARKMEKMHGKDVTCFISKMEY